jgi:hypothetical protein
MKAKLYGIAYDTDLTKRDEDNLPQNMVMVLPKEIRTKKAATQYVHDFGADHISDKTGWCVKDFLFEVVK